MMEVFEKNIVDNLPTKKRELYQFIVGIEDKLAQQAETKEQFLMLLKKHLPHLQAAHRFDMTLQEIVNLMHEIEDEINNRLENKMRRYQWIDYTEHAQANHHVIQTNTQYFLVLA